MDLFDEICTNELQDSIISFDVKNTIKVLPNDLYKDILGYLVDYYRPYGTDFPEITYEIDVM